MSRYVNVNRTLALLTMAFLATLDAASPAAAQSAACDRACLTGMADAYFAALGARDPSRAPMAPTVRFTEQTQALKVGEGLWKTASGAPTTRPRGGTPRRSGTRQSCQDSTLTPLESARLVR